MLKEQLYQLKPLSSILEEMTYVIITQKIESLNSLFSSKLSPIKMQLPLSSKRIGVWQPKVIRVPDCCMHRSSEMFWSEWSKLGTTTLILLIIQEMRTKLIEDINCVHRKIQHRYFRFMHISISIFTLHIYLSPFLQIRWSEQAFIQIMQLYGSKNVVVREFLPGPSKCLPRFKRLKTIKLELIIEVFYTCS